ncbi:hypothetical protein GQ43DRAFT_443772 [Delitschia confertaspora ATCC 74209]|uniref:Uncharacterized protein n=1 Tax=Delitschia confertaspora ATCC 74209 TaxID=1513339 RepID=A0A9P4MM67_9PLEO|nr:hypothetical protein GQ43DRAFT_443772 [Delitschia confertaspora ATCC 74209]
MVKPLLEHPMFFLKLWIILGFPILLFLVQGFEGPFERIVAHECSYSYCLFFLSPFFDDNT